MTPTLQEAANNAGVQTTSYIKGDKDKKHHYIAYEDGATTVVHSRSKEELADLLVSFAAVKRTGISLVVFGGQRGFNIKTVVLPEDASNRKDDNGSRITTTDGAGTAD